MTPEEIVADDVARNGPYGVRVDRWRLNAPVGYRWTDEDVLFEKKQSVLNGMFLGMLCGGLLAIGVLAPQVAVAHRDEDRARADYRELVDDFNAHCKVDSSDGSARCDPNTFPSDYGKAGAK